MAINLFAVRTCHDTELFTCDGLNGGDHVVEKGTTCDLMENLARLGFHASPLTCGEDYDNMWVRHPFPLTSDRFLREAYSNSGVALSIKRAV